MKRLALMVAMFFSVVTASAIAAAGARFVGTPTCTANNTGTVTCTARVTGIPQPKKQTTFAIVVYQAVWECVADPSITVTADTGVTVTPPVTDGQPFTVRNLAHTPMFYEEVFGLNFGCLNEDWVVVRYENVVIHLFGDSDASYVVGTIYPS
jgi:hypothetical protein